MSEIPATSRDLQRVHARLRAAVISQGIADKDADEIVGEALSKVAREQPRMDAPSFEIRARAALKDALIEYRRRVAAEKRPETVPDSNTDEPCSEQNLASYVELSDSLTAVRHAVGSDGVEFVVRKLLGYTEREIAALSGWDALRVGRARKKLERARTSQLFQDLSDPVIHQQEAS